MHTHTLRHFSVFREFHEKLFIGLLTDRPWKVANKSVCVFSSPWLFCAAFIDSADTDYVEFILLLLCTEIALNFILFVCQSRLLGLRLCWFAECKALELRTWHLTLVIFFCFTTGAYVLLPLPSPPHPSLPLLST